VEQEADSSDDDTAAVEPPRGVTDALAGFVYENDPVQCETNGAAPNKRYIIIRGDKHVIKRNRGEGDCLILSMEEGFMDYDAVVQARFELRDALIRDVYGDDVCAMSPGERRNAAEHNAIGELFRNQFQTPEGRTVRCKLFLSALKVGGNPW
jgi:hypothetical protein